MLKVLDYIYLGHVDSGWYGRVWVNWFCQELSWKIDQVFCSGRHALREMLIYL